MSRVPLKIEATEVVGKFVATVVDGDVTLTATSATRDSAMNKVRVLLAKRRKEIGECLLCGARRDRCVC
jgi:hypothetical protein